MRLRSLKFNVVVYSIRMIANMLMPLITFPYVCRVLNVEAIGKVNFAISVVAYFALVAGLGIEKYGTKEGARIRDNPEKLEQFVSELITLNLITTVIAYAAFAIFLILSLKAKEYLFLLLIISVNISSSLIGAEWVFSIFEEYLYITVRSFLIQVLSVVFLFLFVKNEQDIYWYAVYSVMIDAGSNLVNLYRIPRLVRVRLCFSKRLLPHVKPILVFFLYAISGNILLNSDVTILGYLSNDKEVGYYAVAAKLFNLLRTLLYSFIVVPRPRLNNLYACGKKDEYYALFTQGFLTLIMLAIPATAGVYLLRFDVIRLLSGEQYGYSAQVLSILLLALPIKLFGAFISSGNLVVVNRENLVCAACGIAAVANVVLNLILIPYYGAKAAAFTTILSESLVLGILLLAATRDKNLFHYREFGKNTAQILAAAAVMSAICSVVKNWFTSDVLCIAVVAAVGVCVYFGCLLLLRNQIVKTEWEKVLRKLRRR